MMTTRTCEAETEARFDDVDRLHDALESMVDTINGNESLAAIFKGEWVKLSLKVCGVDAIHSDDEDGAPASHESETDDDANVLCELKLPAHVTELHGDGPDAASMVLTSEWCWEQELPVRHDEDLPTARLSGPLNVFLKDCDVQCLGALFDQSAEVIVRIKDESDGEGDGE